MELTPGNYLVEPEHHGMELTSWKLPYHGTMEVMEHHGSLELTPLTLPHSHLMELTPWK